MEYGHQSGSSLEEWLLDIRFNRTVVGKRPGCHRRHYRWNFRHPRDQDDWKKQNFSIAGGWTSGNWSSQIRYRRTGMQTDIDRSAYTDDDNYTLDFTRQLISGELKWKKAIGSWG